MKYTRFSFFEWINTRACKRYIALVTVLTTFLACSYQNMVYAHSDNVTAIDVVTSSSDTEIDITELTETANADLGLTCQACVLMEASTGTIIYEKAMDERLSPASITKIMTLVLIFEALETGQIKLTDEVTTSAYAKSMGGSQVFLEEGEMQTVETLIKCIVVASGNDASVTMAEYIAGTETEFVNRMNAKAAELGMKNTHFEDCCGLTDSDNHYSSAKDVAIMSRELITKYKDIFKYSTIWMENITHVTEKETSEFGLANTNKLLKQYPYATGLKTGSTSKAKYCVSATANKDGIELIAVVMAAPNYKVRFSEAEALLNYGYGVCKLYQDNDELILESQPVKGGVKENVKCEAAGKFSYLSTDGTPVEGIEKKITYEKEITAPVKKGAVIGKITYSLNGKDIGSVNIVATEAVAKSGFSYFLEKLLQAFWL